MALSKTKKLILIAAILIIIDQVTKVLVKTNMHLGESFSVLGSWFQILFVENPGMAFGMSFGGAFGKVMLTIIRIILVVFLFYYIRKLLKKETPIGVLVGLTLILVGALGNIIDCLFYGVIFGESTYMSVAEAFPLGGGYAPFFMGKVVDMLYFPIIDTTLPTWMPFRGGERFIFFSPVFNIADSCITCGALYLLLFKWRFFSDKKK